MIISPEFRLATGDVHDFAHAMELVREVERNKQVLLRHQGTADPDSVAVLEGKDTAVTEKIAKCNVAIDVWHEEMATARNNVIKRLAGMTDDDGTFQAFANALIEENYASLTV